MILLNTLVLTLLVALTAIVSYLLYMMEAASILHVLTLGCLASCTMALCAFADGWKQHWKALSPSIRKRCGRNWFFYPRTKSNTFIYTLRAMGQED